MVLAKPAPTLVAPDDATLVAQARAGDERAFATLYRRHARYIAGVAFRLLGDEADLDDVVQEAFVDAAGALGSLRDAAEFRPWLVAIAVRRVYKRLRRRRRWRWLTGAVALVAPSVSDPALRAEVQSLYEALDRLDPALRVPWVLHKIEAVTLPEAARACGVSLATVKRRIAEADEVLEGRLQGA